MGLFDWTEIEEGLASMSRFIASLQNSIYDAGQVSEFALKSEGGGGRTSGSNSSANNGEGGNESDDNKSSGSSEGIFKSIYNFFKKLITGKSEWVWDGVDYGSRDALVAATSRKNGEGAANDGRRRYTTPEVVVEAENGYGYSGDNLFYECYVQYQMGGGEKGDFHVNANALNLNWVRQGNLSQIGNTNVYSLNLVSPLNYLHLSKMFSSEALALGSINLTKIGDEIYRINDDRYDFDIHWNENRWDNGYFTFRNVFTTGAGLLHGNIFDNQPLPIIGNATISSQFGGPFNIKFHGTIRIKK